MDKIHINLGSDSYDILIDNGLVSRAGPAIRDLTGASKAAIITEDGIDRLYGTGLVKSLEEAGIRTQMIVVPSVKNPGTFTSSAKSTAPWQTSASVPATCSSPWGAAW